MSDNSREALLREAISIVTDDRESVSDEPEDNFRQIADYWSLHLDTHVRSHDVAIMMTLLKLARLKSSPTSRDGWVDSAGYMACGGEIALAT
jgi:hypothetical protein